MKKIKNLANETQKIEREKINSTDWSQAIRFCNIYLNRKIYETTSENYDDALAFTTAIIVTYIRPFSTNKNRNGDNEPSDEIYVSVLTEQEKSIHIQIKNLRNKLFAHSDALDHDVLVYTSESGGLITQTRIPHSPLEKEEVECLLANLKKFNDLNEEKSKDCIAEYIKRTMPSI